MAESVLIVEDEEAIADAVAYALEGEGFEVDRAGDGEEALARARDKEYELIVLDLRLPKVNGIEVTRILRGESIVPILMLTAKDSEVDRVVGLEVGADDYVTKPFSMAELISRVRAILRRRQLDRLSGEPVRRVGGLRLDLVRHEVRVDDENVRLTPSEFRLLTFLAEEPERVYSRREIMQHLWQSEYVGDERATDMHVSNLRRKIERDPDNPERVVTVRGIGYKLVPGANVKNSLRRSQGTFIRLSLRSKGWRRRHQQPASSFAKRVRSESTRTSSRSPATSTCTPARSSSAASSKPSGAARPIC